MEGEAERIFRLMSILWPEYDLKSVWVALRSTNARIRANALELLDNLLAPSLRELLVPLFDGQVGVEERVAIANRLVGASMTTSEEAVAALLASDDPWLKSCGAYAVGVLHLHQLEPELERLTVASNDPLLRETAKFARAKLAESAAARSAPRGQVWESSRDEMGVG